MGFHIFPDEDFCVRVIRKIKNLVHEIRKLADESDKSVKGGMGDKRMFEEDFKDDDESEATTELKAGKQLN